MSCNIIVTPDFEREVKALAKRYRTFKQDITDFSRSLQDNPLQGADLGDGLRKIRMAIGSKGKGKAGGARVITYNILTKELDGDVYLLEIYDKSEATSVDIRIIRQHLKTLGIQ